MNELDHELLIFDRPVSMRLGKDWLPVSFPDSFFVEIGTPAAEWLLAQHSNEPVPAGVKLFLAELRGEVANATAQTSMELS